jgi:LmbE family N-acetylglucosaminyl deacetylase
MRLEATPANRGAAELAATSSDRGVRAPFTLLGVWAHPDDETYLSAALMRRVVASGGHVVLICATRGELGTDDPRQDPWRLAGRRERELRTAMAQLGVHDVWVLGHPDGACADVDDVDVVPTLTDAMRSLQPDLVVTFGPDGITNHPDHRAISRWTTLAWLGAGEHRDHRLLYATMTRSFVERHRLDYSEIPLTVEGAPIWTPEDEIALRIEPDSDERARKRAALRSHESQIGGLVEVLGEDRFHDWWLVETFRRPTRSELASLAGLSARRRARANA